MEEKTAIIMKNKEWLALQKHIHDCESEIMSNNGTRPEFTDDTEDAFTVFDNALEVIEEEIEEKSKTHIMGKSFLVKYSAGDIVSLAKGDGLGWAVAEQLEDILYDKEALEDLNSNAIKIIRNFLEEKEEFTLANKLTEWLEKVD